MGAPKQRWTAEEEAALKAGISKHGVGKWSNILKDEEFNHVLRSRSNVDLKDKWRNINCMASGSVSRQRKKQKHGVSFNISPPTTKRDEEVLFKINPPTIKLEEEVVADKEVPDIVDAFPHAFREIPEDATITKKQIIRMDDVVMEAIKKLNEPRGSSRTAIAQYIEDHYSAPSELAKAVAANLKVLTDNGLIVKVKHRFRIAPEPFSFAVKREPTLLPAIGSNKDPCEAGTNSDLLLTKALIEAELEKMKYMNAEESAKAAAHAVAEAEAAIAAAEAAAREAEEAEAEAVAARCFAEATEMCHRYPTIRVW